MYTRLVVPLDGSAIAESALDQAIEFATLTGASLHLVRVVDAHSFEQSAGVGIGFDYSTISTLLETELEDAKSYLASKANDLAGVGRTVSHAVVTGPVARSIVAQTEPGDLIVIASHGRTGVARWFLGSVAEDVMRHASVPVLMVRHNEG